MRHVSGKTLASNKNFLDVHDSMGHIKSVDSGKKICSSVMGSPVASDGGCCPQHFCRHATGEPSPLKQPLPSPTLPKLDTARRSGTTSGNVGHFQEENVRYVASGLLPVVDQVSPHPSLRYSLMNESLNNRSLSSAREESKALPELPFGILWDVCAWCVSILGAHLCHLKDDGQISHTACRPCFAKQMGFAVVLLIPWCLIEMALGGGK